MARESTSHFSPMSEVITCIKRIFAHRVLSRDGIGRDMGLHLNATLRPVSGDAVLGGPGGAFVVQALPITNLISGDVIVGVELPDGNSVVVDSRMTVDAPYLWNTGHVDIRTVMCTWPTTSLRQKVKLRIVRKRKIMNVTTTLSKNLCPSRVIIPDCEPVTYMAMGGLIAQIHASKMYEDLCTPPIVMITHVNAACAFTRHDSMRLKGRIIQAVEIIDRSKRVEQKIITSLQNLHDATRNLPSNSTIVLVLGDTTRVAAKTEELVQAEKVALSRGIHTVILTPQMKISLPPSPADAAPKRSFGRMFTMIFR